MFGEMIDNPNELVFKYKDHGIFEDILNKVCKAYELEHPEYFFKHLGEILLLLSNLCLSIFDHPCDFKTCERALPEACSNILIDQALLEDFKRLNIKNLDSQLFLSGKCKGIVHLTDWVNAYNKFIDDMVIKCDCPCVTELKIKPKTLTKEMLENPHKHFDRNKGNGTLTLRCDLHHGEMEDKKSLFIKKHLIPYNLDIEIENPHYYSIEDIIVTCSEYNLKFELKPEYSRYKVEAHKSFKINLKKDCIMPKFKIKINYKVDKNMNKTFILWVK